MTDLRHCDVCADHAPGHDWRLCHACTRTLEATLTGIADCYRRLDPLPGNRRVGRVAPGYRSTPAARLDVLLLTDPRTRLTREDRWVTATVNELRGWVELLDGEPASTVAQLADQLRGNLDRVVAAAWAADAYTSLAAHHRELRRVLGELEPSVTVGPCPVLVAADPDGLDEADERDDVEPRPCGGRIRAAAFGRTATCGRCGSTWRGLAEWRALGRALGPAEMDAAEMARFFGLGSASTVRTWAHRDSWPRRRAGGRTVYPLRSALETWARVSGVPDGCDENRREEPTDV